MTSMTELVTETEPEFGLEGSLAREPGGSRRAILLDDPEEDIRWCKEHPGQSRLIAAGDITRHGAIAQTRIRIVSGQPRSPWDRERHPGGAFAAKVSTDRSVEDRIAPVELYVRWVPGGTWLERGKGRMRKR